MHRLGAAGPWRPKTMRAITIILGVAVALAVASGATAAGTGGSNAILDALNAERAANGIPAGVRENRGWSAKCAEHVAYMAATGSLSHSEDPASTRYTAGGNWAGEHSVIAFGPGRGTRDPFANAPLHLIQLLSPMLQQVGIADDSTGYLCITTWPGYRSGTAKPTVYTYPGDGATGVPFAETASELPFVPGDFVGLPRGTATGFNIMVFAEGIANPWRARLVSATVRGPGGKVAVKTVDRTTPTVGAYLPPGSGLVIPASPLQPGTTYRATVRFAGGSAHTWRFTTARA
jgi:Cysteine-rich secretory protein family